MDVVFYAKKKFVPILNIAHSPVILVPMCNVKSKLRSYVIVGKIQKLFLAHMKVKQIFVVMKFVENN